MKKSEIETAVFLISKLPALGTRSARRIVLHLLQNKDTQLIGLTDALKNLQENVKTCPICGNFDTTEICSICRDETRDASTLCIVRDVSDLWAMERAGFYKGKYHILGGILSAIEGILPEDLNISNLAERIVRDKVQEVILALPATVDGQITSQYIIRQLKPFEVKLSTLAMGLPVGAELDYMDDGTIELALQSRKEI